MDRRERRLTRQLHRDGCTPLLDLMSGYEQYLRGESRSDEGRRRYVWTLKRAWQWWDDRLGRPATNADLTPATVQEYKEALGGRGASASSIINALAAIRDFSLFAIIKGLREDDPTAGVRRPPKRRPAPNPLYPDDIRALVAALQPRERPGSRAAFFEQRNRVVVLFFLYTGLRISEVANLRWRHLKLEAGLVEVRREKNDKDRTVDLHPHLIEELRAFLPAVNLPSAGVFVSEAGTPMTDKGLANIFRRWLPKRFAREHVYAHRLRHTFASLLVWGNENLRVVQELLGHAQLSTTEYYIKVDRTHTRAAISRLPRLEM